MCRGLRKLQDIGARAERVVIEIAALDGHDAVVPLSCELLTVQTTKRGLHYGTVGDIGSTPKRGTRFLAVSASTQSIFVGQERATMFA